MLDIHIEQNEGHELNVPVHADMNRMIKENASIPSRVKFIYKGKELLSLKNINCSIEWQD